MNFDFSDDQKFLKSVVRKFLEANAPPNRVRRVLDDKARLFDQPLWKAVAEQGWLGAAIPEQFGGLGLGHLELCVMAEEIGRAVAPIPFASTVYFLAEAIQLAGDDRRKADILPKIAAGEVIGAVATSEGPGVLTPASVQTSVTDGKLDDLPRARWFDMVKGRPSAFSRDLPRRDWVVQIDRSGPNTAFAKVQCQIPPRYFTDYLTLLKVDGRWQVIAKAFHTVTKEG